MAGAACPLGYQAPCDTGMTHNIDPKCGWGMPTLSRELHYVQKVEPGSLEQGSKVCLPNFWVKWMAADQRKDPGRSVRPFQELA